MLEVFDNIQLADRVSIRVSVGGIVSNPINSTKVFHIRVSEANELGKAHEHKSAIPSALN